MYIDDIGDSRIYGDAEHGLPASCDKFMLIDKAIEIAKKDREAHISFMKNK